MKKVIMVAIILAGVTVLSGCNLKDALTKNKSISQDEAKATVKDFIQNNLVAPGTEVNIKEVAKENGLYKVVVAIKMSGQDKEQEINSYLTMDGTKFFPDVMNIEEVTKKIQDSKSAQGDSANGQTAQKEIPKSDKPVVDLYVMSFCPYGNKAEDTLKSVYDLLKNKVTFNFHYIVSVNGDTVQSLHGEKEVVQNEREACVLKNYGKDKWMSFVTYVNANCGSDGSCWETGAANNGISKDKVSACVNSEGVTLMKAEQEASTKANAQGSPTLIINGVSSQAAYQYGNSEAYKKAICDAFNTAPSECSKTLSSSGTASAQGGSCAPAN
jgi:hypothetical protein